MSGSEDKQNFWQLASIFGAGFGIPAMILGKQLALKSGVGTALISIIVGNIVLWIISLGITNMAQNKIHAVKNVKIHAGKIAANLMSFILVIAFLVWYVIQLQSTSDALMTIFTDFNLLQIGIPIGVLVSLLSIGGIQLIKWLCAIIFPFLLIYIVYLMVTCEVSISFEGTWNLCFSDVFVVILATLPGMINLPTFFRHSKSKADSVIGISLIMIFHNFFQICTIFTENNSLSLFMSKMALHNESMIHFFFIAIFVFISCICVNLINVYFASVAWENIILHKCNSRGYMFIGLLGTALFVFFGDPKLNSSLYKNAKYIQIMSTSFIANMGVVLLISFIVDSLVGYKRKLLKKSLNASCWIVGCAFSVGTQYHYPADPVAPVLSGVVSILIAFLIAFFIAESTWSIKNLGSNQNKDVNKI